MTRDPQNPSQMQQAECNNLDFNSDQSHQEYALTRAKLLFGCYRKNEANDPEIFTAAVAGVLADYPREVIEYVTDPRTGLARKSKWMPSVAEIADACEYERQFGKFRRFIGVGIIPATPVEIIGESAVSERVRLGLVDLANKLRSGMAN
jgi:hypothetical protein